MEAQAGAYLMNWQQNSPITRKRPDVDASAKTRLAGSRLVLARVVWAIFTMTTLAVFAACLPIYVSLLRTTCTGALCADKRLTPDAAQTLGHLGISLSFYTTANLALMLIWACIWFVVGTIIAWRKSDDWMGLLVSFWLVIQGTTNATLTVGDSQSSWHWPALLFNTLAFLFFYLVFFLFPDGRFVPRWTRWVMLGLVAGDLLAFLLPDRAFLAPFSSFGGALLLILAQVYRYRRVSTPVQRQQTKWVVYGLILTIVCDAIVVLPTFLLSPGSSQFAVLYGVFFETAITFFTFLIPISFGVAILRSRLWDIDVIINRTLVYGTLSALLVTIYAGLIIGLESLIGLISGQASQPVVIVISTLVIYVLFQPLRRRIQAIIDQRFYRQKYDAEKTLAAFSATLRNEVDLDQLCEQLLAVVQETMQPTHVSLWLRKTDQTKTGSRQGEFSASSEERAR